MDNKYQKIKKVIVTTSMGDEKALRVRPTRSSFSNNVQPPQAQVENIGNTIAFGWANDFISLPHSFAYFMQIQIQIQLPLGGQMTTSA